MKTADIQATLMDHMGDDIDVVNAARVSFAKQSTWQFEDDDNPKSYQGGQHMAEGDERLIKYLAEHNHWSPFSHCFVKFHVKAPIFVARQLQKHVVGLAWNEVSRRYVDNEPEFYIPGALRERAENVKQGSSSRTIDYNSTYVKELKDTSEKALQFYTAMLNGGVCPEQARMILPQNTMTEWIWSGSLYAFARVCQLRLKDSAQLETRYVAEDISTALHALYPYSWRALKESWKNY